MVQGYNNMHVDGYLKMLVGIIIFIRVVSMGIFMHMHVH